MASDPSPDAESLHKGLNALQITREIALDKRNYCSWGTREKMTEEFIRRTGHAEGPHEWQLDVAEAALLGVDATLIAATGLGKRCLLSCLSS